MTKIWFTTDKRSRPIAYRRSYRQMRCFRIGYDEAKMMVASGAAEKISQSPPWMAA